MEPKVESCERTLAFVGSKSRPVLVVYDDVRTSAPTTFDWLLHTLNRMQVKESDGTILVEDGDARMAVRLIATTPCRYSQTGEFPIAPEEPTSTAYILSKDTYSNQWHFTASTTGAVQEVKFLAVLVPYRASEPPPRIVPLGDGSTAGFRLDDVEVAAWWGSGPRGKINAKGLVGDGRLVLKVRRAENRPWSLRNDYPRFRIFVSCFFCHLFAAARKGASSIAIRTLPRRIRTPPRKISSWGGSIFSVIADSAMGLKGKAGAAPT